MPRWRRLCIDVDDGDEVIGASIEYYSDRKSDPEEVLVLARQVWTFRSPAQVLADELDHGFAQGTLSFFPTVKRTSD